MRWLVLLVMMLSLQMDVSGLQPWSPPVLDDIELPPSRLQPPSSLPLQNDPRERVSHTYGKAFRDVVRGLAGDYAVAPDWVARPRNEQQVIDVMD